jgi:hypothetical protein
MNKGQRVKVKGEKQDENGFSRNTLFKKSFFLHPSSFILNLNFLSSAFCFPLSVFFKYSL